MSYECRKVAELEVEVERLVGALEAEKKRRLAAEDKPELQKKFEVLEKAYAGQCVSVRALCANATDAKLTMGRLRLERDQARDIVAALTKRLEEIDRKLKAACAAGAIKAAAKKGDAGR